MTKFAISIDLGGTQLRAALVDATGAISVRQAVATRAKDGPEAVLEQIVTLANSVSAGIAPDAIVGVGVSSPGPIDTIAGRAIAIPTLAGFDDYPMKAKLQTLLPWLVQLENDGISAALGEWQFGAGRGFANVVYVTVSTGIGGGVIADGRVLRGRKGMAAHIGHMILVSDGELCSCGSLGCFEAYGAGPAFVARARKKARTHATTLLGRNGEDVTSAGIFAAFRAGDGLAAELVAEEVHILGTGFASLAHLYSPDVIVVGGGLSNAFDILWPGLTARYKQCAMPAFKDVAIVKAALGDNSGLVGAACLVFGDKL